MYIEQLLHANSLIHLATCPWYVSICSVSSGHIMRTLNRTPWVDQFTTLMTPI